MMRATRQWCLASLCTLSLTLTACGGGGGGCSSAVLGSLAGSACGNSSASTPAPVAPVNQAPSANPGESRSAITGSEVTLNGSGSNDPEGSPLTYEWSLVSRPAASGAQLSGANTARPTFKADTDGAYVFSLRVRDASLWSAQSFVTITTSAANVAPTAVAQAPGQVTVGSAVTLDASASSDPNRDALRYRWSVVSRPAGSNAAITQSDSPRASFTPDTAGAYVFSLAVSDGELISPLTFTTVNAGVANVAPVAVVGPDQNVVVGDSVTVDGTGSTDANRDALTYRWAFVSRPASSGASLANATSARPRFLADLTGVYVLSLTVSDGALDSKPQYVTITVSPANVAPVAATGPNQQVKPASTVTLDGTGSSDRNGDTLSYLWTIVSKPPTSAATLSSRSVARPTFVADVAGLYLASLQVYDGKLYSEAVVTAITADPGNAAPVAKVGPTVNGRVNTPIVLDGSQSSDPTLDPLTYRWTSVSAPEGVTPKITGDRAPIANFTPSAAGIYVFSLTVADEQRSSAPVFLTVNATADNLPPLAAPGIDRSVATSATVVLDGSGSTDPDGDRNALTYTWAFVSTPAGSNARLSGEKTPRPAFTADRNGTYVVSLVVEDPRGGRSQPAIVVITAETGPTAPVANAGPAQTVRLGQAVTLDGTGSTDANGDNLSYLWVITYAPPSTNPAQTGYPTLDELVVDGKSTKNSPKPTFVPNQVGVYVIALLVTDSSGLQSQVATVPITVTAP